MKRIVLAIFCTILLSSCISEQKQQAAEIVADVWQAETSNIGFTKGVDTENGTTNRIELTLTNLQGIDSDYPPKKVTSTSALLLMQNLDPNEYEDRDEINIIVDSHGLKYEKAYSVESLRLVTNLIPLIDRFFDSQQEKSESSFYATIDSKYLNDSIAKQYYSIMELIENENGKISFKKLTGFNFDKIEDGNLDILVLWEIVFNGEVYSNYTFYISLDSRKIINIGINEE